MDMSSLFPNEDALATAMASARPHVSFKAGRMSYDMTTRMVTADPRKGVFQIVTSPEDSLTHLQWRARPGAEVEPQHDLIVFPGDTVMSPVQSTSARVFVLKWIDADTRMFFYMQGGDESADASAITQVNRILNSGPSHQVS